ncbi:outer membrane protein OmpA-like peptidoglycan-associated protein [Silvimonas terrae]|uniref:Outer membrane protein OmpA-like peptidoglycan-associated protein n=1 Tax=Silvimonas terrae TaxID=300266 RepID=A0A840RC27_9NEIS|nr:OmpA family protein [Silvimonas terrae]MBB5190497.1 outer membrane protein OmpA-like peptidoglycan-associated protein [Silvimonas terrae]
MRKIVIPALISALLLPACANDLGDKRSMNNTETGALIGSVGGAVIGAAVDKNHRGRGALIGAVGGGLAGGAIGAYMDKQAKDLQKQLAPEIQAGNINLQRLSDSQIEVTMTSTTGFDTGSAVLKSGFTPTLDKISRVLNQYGKTTVGIVGYTDNVGKADANLALSQRRAQSVSDYLTSHQVNAVRLQVEGRGMNEPRASNATESGRALNRRVELLITAVSN